MIPSPFQVPAVLTESSFGENTNVQTPLFTPHLLWNLACPPQVSNLKPTLSNKFDPRKKRHKKQPPPWLSARHCWALFTAEQIHRCGRPLKDLWQSSAEFKNLQQGACRKSGCWRRMKTGAITFHYSNGDMLFFLFIFFIIVTQPGFFILGQQESGSSRILCTNSGILRGLVSRWLENELILFSDSIPSVTLIEEQEEEDKTPVEKIVRVIWKPNATPPPDDSSRGVCKWMRKAPVGFILWTLFALKNVYFSMPFKSWWKSGWRCWRNWGWHQPSLS